MLRIEARHLVYASGNFGKSILWGTFELTMLFVLTDLLGVPAAVAGLLLLVSMLFDAAIDPWIGHMADRLRTPIGSYGPLILAGAPLSAASFLWLMSLPALAITSLWVIGGLLAVFRLGYSLMDLPHNALLTVMRADSRQRSNIAGYRFAFSTIAGLALALSMGSLRFDNAGTVLSASSIMEFAVVVAPISLIVMNASWWAVRREDVTASLAQGESPDFAAAWAAVWRSPSFPITLAVGSIAALCLPLFGKSIFYLDEYIWKDSHSAAGVLIAMFVGQLFSLPVWIFGLSRWRKPHVLQVAHGVCAIALGIGLLGSSSVSTFLATVLFGLGLGGVYSIIWGMLADCAEEAKSATGIRVNGFLFSIAIFSQQAAIGLGVGAYGVALSAAGYVPHETLGGGAAAVLKLFAFGLPMAGSAACIGLLFANRSSGPGHGRLVGRITTLS